MRHACPIDDDAAAGPARKEAMTRPQRLKIILWAYLAQALGGALIGFTIPLLYYFGFL
jgi:hypothetical protein